MPFTYPYPSAETYIMYITITATTVRYASADDASTDQTRPATQYEDIYWYENNIDTVTNY